MARSLELVAQHYLSALDSNDRHRAMHVVAEHFGVSRATANRDVIRARDAGLIPQEGQGPHHPKRVRWMNGQGESWFACAECRTPWPCTDA